MFNKGESQKGCFLEQTKAAREERANEKRRKDLVITLQAHIRGWHFRRQFSTFALENFDSAIPAFIEDKVDLKPSVEIFKAAQGFLFVWDRERDHERFERLCRYIVLSLESPSKDLSYAGVVLVKEYALQWITHIKKLLKICCSILETLRPELPAETKLILVYLHTLIAFTGTKTWQFLSKNKLDVVKSGMNKICSNIVDYLVSEGLYPTLKMVLLKGLGRSKIVLKNVSLTAIVALSTLPLVNSDFSDKLLTVFLIEIFSTPGLILHLDQLALDCLSRFEKHKILQKIINLLYNEQNIKIVFNALEGSYALCLLANIVNLCYIERETTLQELYYPQLTFVLIWLLDSCQHYVVTKQSNLTHWHPILGWFAQKVDSYLQEALPHVKSQLFLLWSHPFVKIMLGSPLTKVLQEAEPCETTVPPSTPRIASNILKRVVEHRGRSSNSSKPAIKIGSKDCKKIALLCGVYQTTLRTLTQLKLDILTGLCYQDQILYNLWQFFGLLGQNYGLKSFLELLVVGHTISASETPEFLMLQLFCDCMTHYVTILDDLEMFNQQKPFSLADFVALSGFLNVFLYKALLQNLFDARNLNLNPLFQSMHTLLLVLYRRDCRRNYTPENHWLIKEIKVCSFTSDLEKGKKNTQALLQKMPHIIPHYERVQLFRKYVANEKAVFGLTESACASPHSTLITVHRKRIVEDGYRQLALLPPQALKGVIRVRFINEQGLDEAGIDQDGVFKEFLEETIKRVFNPSLNLFRVTSEERLYPSPTSHLQDHHLLLFEFVGRMLGKAVYEGIVVDVPFASFFLSQVLGQQHQALYSSIDELPSLDQELYRSLTYIKHYQGDVQDLDLTFSVDEDYLGKIVTHELVPGGRAIPVTNENKINYIHLMAHFRMHTQIKDQTAAFIRGFRSIINPEWLSLFSTPELQRLISGDNVPLDLKDLRKHTQYYGGFHDSHRVVGWLWDILDKDFSDEEKRLFLKFVTSCSKPPLLGFAHLEPPFSIRCVEVGDDEDTGDTIASVIRVGPSRHSRVSMSSLLQTSGHQGAILAAAQPYYHPQHTHQSPTTPNQDVQPDRPIGYGAFGVVWAVTDPRDGRRVALKKLPNVFQSLVSSKRVLRELKMLCFFKHENVLSALDILQPPHLDFFQEIYVITELLQSDLHKIIVSPQHLSTDHIKVFLYQILRGLKYLHSARILHRDIKPGNLLVNSNCILKICDFGLARVEEPDQSRNMTQEVVTQYYRAPEILMGARHYSAAVDVWSVGCIFGELLGRRVLFQAQSPVQQLELITELLGTPSLGDMKYACEGARTHMLRRPVKLPSLSILYTLSPQATHTAVHLLCQMLVFDPDKRITVADALAHPYLDEGRLRYHSCMCKCCYSLANGNRRFTLQFEPTASDVFDDEWERRLTSVMQVKEEMHTFIADHLNTSGRVPLCINPQSAAFKSFASSNVAHPAELPPSPHQWH